MQKFRQFIEAKITSNITDIKVLKKTNNTFSIVDEKTGGHCLISIDQHFRHDTKEYEGKSITIINWAAYPLMAVTKRDDYIGGGFARNAMKKILEIAKQENIHILEIFGPSNYSLAVLEHYVSKGILKPIPYTKMALANNYTGYWINQ